MKQKAEFGMQKFVFEIVIRLSLRLETFRHVKIDHFESGVRFVFYIVFSGPGKYLQDQFTNHYDSQML